MLSTIQKYRNHIYLHLVVFVWGFTGILGKLISLGAIPLVWYRMMIAFIGLFLFAKFFAKKQQNAISHTKLFAVGLIIALHWILFFEAIKVSTVSVALICMSSTSFFTAFLGPLMLKKRFVIYEVILSIFAIWGINIIFTFESQYFWGITYAIISSFLAALFTIINGKWIQRNSALHISMYEMLGGFVGISIYMIFQQSAIKLPLPQYLDIAYLLLLGLICTSLAFVVSVQVMKEISPFTVTISVNMEPIYAILLALMIFGESEKMTSGFYLGAMVILLTVFMNIWIQSYVRKKKKILE